MDKRDEQAIEAVKAYYQQDLSQAEVAARMGILAPPRRSRQGCWLDGRARAS